MKKEYKTLLTVGSAVSMELKTILTNLASIEDEVERLTRERDLREVERDALLILLDHKDIPASEADEFMAQLVQSRGLEIEDDKMIPEPVFVEEFVKATPDEHLLDSLMKICSLAFRGEEIRKDNLLDAVQRIEHLHRLNKNVLETREKELVELSTVAYEFMKCFDNSYLKSETVDIRKNLKELCSKWIEVE